VRPYTLQQSEGISKRPGTIASKGTHLYQVRSL